MKRIKYIILLLILFVGLFTAAGIDSKPTANKETSLANLISLYGDDFSLERIDYEYCIGRDIDSIRNFYNYYLCYPYKYYYIARWDSIANDRDCISVYLFSDDDNWEKDNNKYIAIEDEPISEINMNDEFSMAYIDSLLPKLVIGNKIELSHELDVKYYDPETQYTYYNKMSWDSLTISDYYFQRLFEEFGKPCSKERIDGHISTAGMLPVDIERLLLSDWDKYCVVYTWLKYLILN